MQLSEKLKTFSEFFRAFSKSSLNFEHFEKKDDPHRLFISEAQPAKIVVRYMCKKSHFRLPFQKEHGKLVSTLFKFERQHLYHIYCSTGRELSCKKSLLVICPRLSLFVNTMSAVDKCTFPNRDNLMQPIYMELFHKLKTSSEFFRAFSKSRLNSEHFKKKMTLIAYLFLRLRPAKVVVRYMCKKSGFKLFCQKENGKRVSTLFKSDRQHLRDIYCSTGRQLSCKESLLVICQRLRLFLNIMSAVEKCSLSNRDNLMQPIHMELSEELKTFS